jgi:hypothetical protein
MVEQPSTPAGRPVLNQGLADLRQTWEQLAREFAAGVPELPGVIDQELAGLSLPDLNEENLIEVAEAVVARVAAAGFPAEASALFRRMGRAMYELLLLLATQEELRGLGMSVPRSAQAAAPSAPARTDPVVGVEMASAPPDPVPVLAVPPAQMAPKRQELPEVAAKSLPEVVSAAAPRDPARPAANGDRRGPIQAATAGPSEVRVPIGPVPDPQSVRHPPAQAAPVAPVTAVPTPAASAPAPPSSAFPIPAQEPPPVPPTATAPALPPPTSVAPVPASTPAVVAAPVPEKVAPDDASFWGFDPAAREVEAAPEPVVESSPPAPARAAPGSPSRHPSVDPSHWARPPTRSGWAVRLSPRTTTEREKKLRARQAQLPPLVDEIVATVKSEQGVLSSKGNARKVLAAARERLPLAEGADPSEQIRSVLESGELEEAATLAIQLAEAAPGEASAAVVCAVGEAVKQSKRVDLAALCFTTAVLCDPPCDRACWHLCNLSVERRDTTLAPVWLEYIARLLRARGADADSIGVYRQLLNLSPRRSDVRELLRISSLTGTLPD